MLEENKMKKILMIGLTPPLEGGSEQHIYEFSSRMKNVDVLTQKGSICKNKKEVTYLGDGFIKNISFALSVYIYAISLLLTLRRKYDVIHLHENTLYFIAPLLRIRYKVIITVHGIKGFKFYDNKYLWLIYRQFLKFANTLVAVNPIDLKMLKVYFRSVKYIPNGVDLSTYEGPKQKIEKKISFIGRINEQKGVVYLLEAFHRIASKHPAYKLELIGQANEYAKELQKKFHHKNIIWKGYFSDRKKIANSLKSAEIITLPSLWEGLPLTLFESLASERPVIISDIPAFKSVIKDEALFFKVRDPKDLTEKIDYLLKNKKKANEIGKKGKSFSTSYDWGEIAKTLEKTYEE